MMISKICKIAAAVMLMGVMVTGGLSNVSAYATSHDWYLYYNDSHTNATANSWSFPIYGEHTYTATHTYRSSSNVYTLIQAGTGTSLRKTSYLVADSKVYVYQKSATGLNSWLVTKLSYNTSPANTSGTLAD